MEHTITFTDDELYTLRYSIAQRIARHEDLISTSRDPIAIRNLSENLATLQAIADKISPLPNDTEEDDKINELAEAIQPVLEKMTENAKRRNESAVQAGAAEQALPFIPFLVRNPSNRGHRKRHAARTKS